VIKKTDEAAARKGEGFPIVFASADDESGLLSWAPVDGMDIDIDGRGYALCRTPSFIAGRRRRHLRDRPRVGGYLPPGYEEG